MNRLCMMSCAIFVCLGSGHAHGQEFAGHVGAIHRLAASPDGKKLLTADREAVRLFDFESGKSLGTLETRQPVAAIAFSRDGSSAFLAENDKNISRWDWKNSKPGLNGRTSKSWKVGSTNQVMARVPTSDLVALATPLSAPKKIVLFNLAEGKVEKEFDVPASQRIIALDFTPDGAMMVGISNSRMYRWNLATGERLPNENWGGIGLFATLAIAPSGAFAVTSANDIGGHQIRYVDLKTGKLIRAFPSARFSKCCILPTETEVFVWGSKQTIKGGLSTESFEVSLRDAKTDREIKSWDLGANRPVAGIVPAHGRFALLGVGAELQKFDFPK